MTTGTQKFGVIGLAVMGENLALNIERNGFPISVYNRTSSVMEEFVNGRAKGKKVFGAKTIEDFVKSLERPRRILVMVKAGKPVDAVVEQLAPLLEPGDIIIDGGNSNYEDTERRVQQAAGKPYVFFGMGVSGGEEGALNGPSLMPGGDMKAYEDLRPILEKIAAKTDTGPCVTYCGRGSAGHFVKMVHNGIEYGDMQLIAESYDLLRNVGGITDGAQMEKIFTDWNAGQLQSFLIEITSKIVNHPDRKSGKGLLLDKIVDAAGQKGTGKWTTITALQLGACIPTITAAVDARIVSSLRGERARASKMLAGVAPSAAKGIDTKQLVSDVSQALYASKICSYAQGMAMLRLASKEFNYGVNMGETARIWKGGCIIRAVFLDRIRKAFDRNNELENLCLDADFAQAISQCEPAWRRVVGLAIANGVPIPAMAASLAWYDGYRRERTSAYVIQAQRDFFGAHTFERIDEAGVFHEQWGEG